MCGIVYVRRFDGKNSKKMVMKRYYAQKSRGSDGFGFISLRDGLIDMYMREAEEKDIMRLLELQNANETIFHHRYPTSTPNFKEAAHPIKVSNPLLKHDYYVVHNGVIRDDDKLKAKHESIGFKYTTELENSWSNRGKKIQTETSWNDSEALAIELAMAFDAPTLGEQVDVDGSIAFVCLQTKKNSGKATKLFFGRNFTNPLKQLMTQDHLIVSSDGPGQSVEAHKLHELNYETNVMTISDFNFGAKWSYVKKEKTHYYPSSALWDKSKETIPGAPWNINKRYEEADLDIDLEKLQIGFNVPLLPTPQDYIDSKTDIDIENEYIELNNKYESLMAELKKIDDPNSPRSQEIEDQIFDISDDLLEHELRKEREAMGSTKE